MNKDLITIDLKSLILAKDKSGEILLTLDAKKELEKIIEAKSLIEKIYEYVQEKLTELMQQNNIKRIVAGNIIIHKRLYGERFKIDNKEILDEKFIKLVEYTKANTEEIEKFVEEKGELPEGISLKERSDKVSISYRNEET